MESNQSHVWVRTDLLQAIHKNNGDLPKNWRPLKCSREDSTWWWCRSVILHTASPNASPVEKTNQPTTSHSPPFSSVKLRKITNSPATLKDRDASWTGSPLKFSKTVTITVQVNDEGAPQDLQNETFTFTYNTADNSKVCTANAWWYQNVEPPEDLTSLEQLHEPAVVSCLAARYQAEHIYTYTGKILLALNPFRSIPSLYGDNVMNMYSTCELQRPPPHIYAVAEDAYRHMLRSPSSAKPENQSILVSGESGAGKTVTTKIIMRYLATMSKSLGSVVGEHSIESQVLQSNPILESFGNARTIRNDNSSRFGKYIDIQFGPKGTLVSALVETYLLEKVRLISQAPGERNYHIFYEVMAGLKPHEKHELRMSNMRPCDFRMTSQSGTYDRRDGVSDRDAFDELQSALDTVGFDRDEQRELFRVVCALLHTSNLKFDEVDDVSRLAESCHSLKHATDMLGVGVNALNAALCQCAIEARGEVLYKNLSISQSEKALEALIKATYHALFMYIVNRINGIMMVRQQIGSPGRELHASIGVLDIFGFESFETNSFEQLCINYTNEALQQQFNRFVFKLEQQEYQREGIDWSFISFPDNQDVLDLIEKKHDGILSLLDENSRLQRCTDKTFALAVYEKCSDHPRFEASNVQRAMCSFAIQHYAGLVEYNTDGIIEKNKDELPKETTMLLLTSSSPFLMELGRTLTDAAASPRSKSAPPRSAKKPLNRSGSSIMRDGVGSQFSQQLKELRTRIESTEPHYIRTLKPNDDLVPDRFDATVIADQLRCAGVLEAIRVSRVGFPHRYQHAHFIQRYEIIVRHQFRPTRGQATRDSCKAFVDLIALRVAEIIASHDETTHGVGTDNETRLGIQLGKTKVFLRRRAFDALELLRIKVLTDAACKIQSILRMKLGYKALRRIRARAQAVEIIQRGWRYYEARMIYQRLRLIRLRKRAVYILQGAWRCYQARKVLWAGYTIAWWCQSVHRGIIARQYCAYLYLDAKASIIQRRWRCHQRGPSYFRLVRSAVITIQKLQRASIAKQELYRLRREAKDLQAVAAERDRLREESRHLRQQLEKAKRDPSPDRDAKAEEVRRLRGEIRKLRIDLDKAHRFEATNKAQAETLESLMYECMTKEHELVALKSELLAHRSRDDSSISFLSFASGATPVIHVPSLDEFPAFSKRNSPAKSDISLLDKAQAFEEQSSFSVSTSRVTDLPDIAEVAEEEVRYFHGSIRQGNLELFHRILEQSSSQTMLVNEGDKFGRTALHHAVLRRHPEIVTVLLEHGAAVNVQDEDGETPLHLSEDFRMTELLLNKGKANPNVPNVDGICSLHLAVQRRDIDSVRALLRKNAHVNEADHIRWFTPLHLIALPPRNEEAREKDDVRLRIAHLLCGSLSASKADLDFQDSEGNSPLHFAVQLDNTEAFELVAIFLENGASANLCNTRKQTPLHLLCHNDKLRPYLGYQDALHALLVHGADPNIQSLTGCTALHLSLYHRDIDSACQLVERGAELHLVWQKPKRWSAFWADMGSSVLALDMVNNEDDLCRILGSIVKPQQWAPTRSWCMHCRSSLGATTKALHCRHCSRLICEGCASSCLPACEFPTSFQVVEASWVCVVCDKLLHTDCSVSKDETSHGTAPTSSNGESDDARYEC